MPKIAMSNENYGDYGNYPPPPLPPPVPPPLPSKKEEGIGKYALLIGGGCFLLLLFAGGIGFFIYYIFNSTADPLRIVNQQLAALRENNLEKAYTFCSKGFKENTNYESFQTFVTGNPQLKDSTEFKSLNRQVDQGTAKLKGNLIRVSGSTSPAEFHLIREGRAWKIQYIDLTSKSTAENSGSDISRDPIPSNAEPQREIPSSPQLSGATNGLRIDEVKVEQQPQGNVSSITIRFKVFGFGTDESGRTPRIHIIQDLKTFDPNGNILPDLSRDGIKNLEDFGTFDYVDLWNSLSIPTNYPRGTYRCELTIHDQVTGGDTTSSAQFDLQ